MDHYPELTADDVEALEAFKAYAGRNWRATLSDAYWFNARIWTGPKPNMGNRLHALRNNFGPAWLFDVCRLPSEQRKARGK